MNNSDPNNTLSDLFKETYSYEIGRILSITRKRSINISEDFKLWEERGYGTKDTLLEVVYSAICDENFKLPK